MAPCENMLERGCLHSNVNTGGENWCEERRGKKKGKKACHSVIFVSEGSLGIYGEKVDLDESKNKL